MNQEKFLNLRNKYPKFIYDSYKVIEETENIKIIYNFEIEGLTKFEPYCIINKKYITNNNVNKDLTYLI